MHVSRRDLVLSAGGAVGGAILSTAGAAVITRMSEVTRDLDLVIDDNPSIATMAGGDSDRMRTKHFRVLLRNNGEAPEGNVRLNITLNVWDTGSLYRSYETSDPPSVLGEATLSEDWSEYETIDQTNAPVKERVKPVTVQMAIPRLSSSASVELGFEVLGSVTIWAYVQSDDPFDVAEGMFRSDDMGSATPPPGS